MKNLKKLMVLSVAALVLSACGSTPASSSQPSSEPSSQPSSEPSSEPSSTYSPITPVVKPTTWEREEDNDVYDRVLGEYELLMEAAKAIKNDNERFVKYAEAEAFLMDSAVLLPTYTQGGTYAMTRVAPRTVPYAMWGNDDDRLKGLTLIEHDANKLFIKGSERAEMIELWDAARKGGEPYNAKAYLEGKGYTIADKYQTSFSSTPQTLDVLDTSKQRDTETIVNAIEGLVEYDQYGVMQPRLAKAIPTPVSVVVGEDEETGEPLYGYQYTFEIRDDAFWYTSDKQQLAPVTADDFVAGFQHMLDAKAGLEWLVQGVVKGANEYLKGTATFDEVGYKVVDGKLQITLEYEEAFFLTRLTYSCFMPLNRAFFLSKGGAFGITELAAAKAAGTYQYGVVSNLASMCYNSAYIPTELTNNSKITYQKNNGYYDKDKVVCNELSWVYDAGDNPDASYASAKNGDYAGIGLALGNGLLDKAKEEGLFEPFQYVADTNSTTYFCGVNLNRGNWVNGTVISAQGETQKIDTHYALNNANFRRALQHAWDRKTWNGVAVGEELAELSLRNIYTAPEFLTLSEAVTYGNHVFTKGTPYGDIVEYFLVNEFDRECETSDGVDGWYNPELAQMYLDRAKADCGQYWAKVELDIVCYSSSKNQVAYARAFKNSIERSLGADNVQVNIVNTTNLDDYYNAGYDAENGEACNYDLFWGSGWGPDYGDPSTYLDTFAGDGAGYMTRVIGLYGD